MTKRTLQAKHKRGISRRQGFRSRSRNVLKNRRRKGRKRIGLS